MRLTISKNVLAQYLANRTQTYRDIIALNPNDVLIMDDMQYAQALSIDLPACRVVHRAWNRDDAEFHVKQTAQWFVDSYCRNVPAGVTVQYCNEPSGKVNLPLLAHKAAAVMRLAHPVRIATPAFALQNPILELDDELDVLIRAFGEFPNCIWSQHIYFRDNPESEPVKLEHLEVVLKRFKKLGVPVPHVQISECGRDIGGGEEDGWLSAGWNEDQYADKVIRQAELIEALLNKYEARSGGMNVYCEGFGAESDATHQPQWRNFNTEGKARLHGRFVTWNKEHIVVSNAPPPDYGTRQPAGTITLVGASVVNIRNLPTTQGSIVIGQFRGSEVVPYFEFHQNGWWRIEVNGRDAFVSATYITIAPFVPEPEIELPPFPSSIEEMENWRHVFKSLETSMSMAVIFIDEWLDIARAA